MTFDLRAYRVDRGLTITDVAQATGVSRRAIRRAEHGGVPQAPVAKAIADWVGRPASELWPTPSAAERAA